MILTTSCLSKRQLSAELDALRAAGVGLVYLLAL